MTIGTLSRWTAAPVKALRAGEDMGLIYPVDHSPGNYRLFGEDALWCVQVVCVGWWFRAGRVAAR
jgi:DNA-binding transcriptional MerR regulator